MLMTGDRFAGETEMATSTRRQAVRRWISYVIRSFGFAFGGIGQLVRTERNAQIQTAAMLAVIAAGVIFRVSALEWIALVLSISLVLALEGVNSAIEAVVNLVSPQYHPLAKRAKDVGAGAVLIAALGAAVVGCFVFLPRLF